MLTEDRCRVLGIIGIGGIGKTSLAVKALKPVADDFQRVIWRSVINAPPPEELLGGILEALTTEPPEDVPVGQIIDDIVRRTRATRILIVLDNVESLLDEEHAGRWREGYEAYGRFFRRMGETPHMSTVVFTGRNGLPTLPT